MEKLAALKLDFKDEPEFIKFLYPDFNSIPEFIKNASVEEPQDHEYALILEQDGYQFKKFATHDAGNTAISIMYFMNNYNKLPQEAVKLANDNLIYAAGRYRLKVPEQLKELSKSLTEKGIPVTTREKHWVPVENLKAVDDISSGKVERNLESNPKGINALNEGIQKKASFIPAALVGGAAGMASSPDDRLLGGIIGASVGGTTGAIGKRVGASKLVSEGIAPAMMGGLKVRRTDNSISVKDKNLPSKSKSSSTTKKTAMLLDKYPIDTPELTKLADKYFNENWREFSPYERHEYCTKLASKMREFLLSPSEKVASYNHTSYSDSLSADLNVRKNFLPPDYHDIIDNLESNITSVKPETFAEALTEFDKQANLDRFWDSRIKDPYQTTFGPKIKVANDWNYNKEGVYISESDLDILANSKTKHLRKQFGEEFAFKFRKNPKKEFQALDEKMKHLIAKMCQNNS